MLFLSLSKFDYFFIAHSSFILQMIKNIEAESHYHSFILIQAHSVEIAQKLPYHVLSANNQLLFSDFDRDNQPNFRYNYTIDCVSYNFAGKNILLSEGAWLNKFLTQSESITLKDKRYIFYNNLNISTVTSLQYTEQVLAKQAKQNEKLFFYYYSGQKSRKFVKVIPKIIHYCDCVLFQLPNSYFQHEMFLFPKNHEKLPVPKHIPDNQKLNNIYSHLSKISPNNLLNLKFFHFNSEYSLMSDQHFLNCLVHGKRNICSYVKIEISDKSQYSLSVLKNQIDQLNQKKFRLKDDKRSTNPPPNSIFYWWIHPQIYKMLLQVYEKPKL